MNSYAELKKKINNKKNKFLKINILKIYHRYRYVLREADRSVSLDGVFTISNKTHAVPAPSPLEGEVWVSMDGVGRTEQEPEPRMRVI